MTKITGRRARLHNRRVFLGRTERGWAVRFSRLPAADEARDPRQRVVHTDLRLSDEAMGALVRLYHVLDSEPRPVAYTVQVVQVDPTGAPTTTWAPAAPPSAAP